MKRTIRMRRGLLACIMAGTGLGLLLCTAAPARGGEEPAIKWENVASLGVTLTRGNSENFLATGSINSSRKSAKNEILLGASAGYGENTTHPATGPSVTTRTDDYLKGYAQWNYLITERFFVGVRITDEHDNIADVDYRVTLSPLAGYYFIKRTNVFLVGEAGPSVIWEKVGGRERSYIAARLAERFEFKFKNGAKIWESLEVLPNVSEVEDYLVNAEVGIAAPISKSLDIRMVVQDTYDNRPAPGREKNDLKLIAGIGYKF
jgi:putative salt-induced outer membrane protein YdiY